MGVRLYPNTKNTRNLEILAGMPEGTHARLEALRASFQVDEAATFFERQDRYEKLWNAVHEDDDLANLDGFLTFGWGKFDGIGLANGYAGSLTDLAHCAMVLRANGIDATHIRLMEGIHWC